MRVCVCVGGGRGGVHAHMHACVCMCLYVCACTHACLRVYTVTTYHKLSQNRQGQNTGCNVQSVFNVAQQVELNALKADTFTARWVIPVLP